MKRLVVHIIAPGPIAGAEKVVITGLNALIRQGENVHCYIIQEQRSPTLATQFQQALGQVPNTIFISRYAFDPFLLQRLRRQLKIQQVSLIHTHGFKALFYATWANTKARLIHTHHGDTAHTLKVKFYEWLAYRLMQNTNHVIAVSQLMKLQLQNYLPHYTPISLISNMLPLIPQSRAIHYQNGPIKLIYVGRLSEEKGLQYFIPILADFPQITLSIVGDGPQREQLQQLIQTHALQKQISFLGYRTEISSLLVDHHALVLPSLREGLPLTLIEAACSGLAIFAAKVGGIPEIVTPTKNGILFSHHQPITLKKYFTLFCQQLPRLLSNAQAQKKYFCDYYSAQRWAKNTTDLYSKVISS